MEDYEELYKSICRVCLSCCNSENMVSLTDNSSEDGLSCYGKAVAILSNISMKNDSLPNKMCAKCLFLLKQAIIFRKTCEQSHANLEILMQKLDSSDSNFKEKLCDFVLYTNNFPVPVNSKTVKTRRVRKSLKKSEETLKISAKNEPSNDFDDSDNNMDFSDLFLDNYIQEPDPPSQIEENIDSLLDNMEIIVNLKPGDLQIEQKKYYYPNNQNDSNTSYNKDKRKRKCHSKEDLQCKICLKVLATPGSYQAHVQRHSGGQYICEQCGRQFVTNAELQYHLASSHDIGPFYICKVCGFKAPKMHELKEHERLHTGERPYTCDKCGLTFRRRYIWKKHALYHMEKTVQCQLCSKKFHQKGELMAHINGVHERMYIYACSQCDVTYAKTGTVRRHMTEKHGIAREMQGKIKRINLGKPSSLCHLGKSKTNIINPN